MLADALAPHGGVVMWRAFVYSDEEPDDRHKQAYNEFVPLDGSFRGNVLVQVKNGAIDFQPREPFHPLFGAMPATPLVMEFQITKEYLGSTHIAYKGELYEEGCVPTRTAAGAGSTVAKVVDGSLHGHALSGIASVANIGSDRNWSVALRPDNWYAYGRLAWIVPVLPRHRREWVRATFQRSGVCRAGRGHDDGLREAVVDYTGALGLHHLMGAATHYGPGPGRWRSARGLDVGVLPPGHARGIGFDRTTPEDGVAYAPVAEAFDDPARVPEEFLLWFHHVPWDARVPEGRCGTNWWCATTAALKP